MTTDLYRFYKKAGLKISNLSLAFEYPKTKPLDDFVTNITNKRKEASIEKDDQKQKTYKLIANSAWGRLNINRSKFRNRIIKKVEEEDVEDQFFCSAETIISEFETEYKELVRKPTSYEETTPCK